MIPSRMITTSDNQNIPFRESSSFVFAKQSALHSRRWPSRHYRESKPHSDEQNTSDNHMVIGLQARSVASPRIPAAVCPPTNHCNMVTNAGYSSPRRGSGRSHANVLPVGRVLSCHSRILFSPSSAALQRLSGRFLLVTPLMRNW
jgi:hypothetical protein